MVTTSLPRGSLAGPEKSGTGGGLPRVRTVHPYFTALLPKRGAPQNVAHSTHLLRSSTMHRQQHSDILLHDESRRF
jgi:hypothetical protein